MERQREETGVESIEMLKQKLIENFRNELPVLRARARVSQETLAEKIGISRQSYNNFETGKKEMTWTTFLALVAYFQNNERTKQIIDMIDNFNEDMTMIMEAK